ncbi:MAG: hypothetical protein ACLUAR_17880 [Pilosibacter sp.]
MSITKVFKNMSAEDIPWTCRGFTENPSGRRRSVMFPGAADSPRGDEPEGSREVLCCRVPATRY